MSLLVDGRRVACDGTGCDAAAFLPVALRPSLRPSVAPDQTTAGWLFVTGGDGPKHYCPNCTGYYLAGRLSETAGSVKAER